ncbi:MAG: hypothetical protein A2992_00750 [Elusimicrobia bacterium RIFCSPLOWO2_01_FULL_59_12]|nr:MAG: hypothetical protein A2992_00750 [Elusimicrobia bacterium RIFCSPLOWO2_01_FULL_59_12]
MGEEPSGQILIYQAEDNKTRLEVKLQDETVWLTQKQMADLFQKDVRTINEHIQNVFEEGELARTATIRKFRIVQSEGAREVAREVEHYNLDVIISVGYRVKSQRGTQFRIWATQRLRDYLVKGFAMDDARLAEGGVQNRYFDELLERIRAIRASERNFYRKVLDIYSTSIDYDPHAPISQTFFATVQNKMHWAVHGHTAAEIIVQRANADKPNMGLTSWKGKRITPADTGVAKNYLAKEELEILNLIVSQYLDFAELQARTRKPMPMADWVRKLDDFLRLNDRQILQDAGKVSAMLAEETAAREFEKFQKKQAVLDAERVDKDFEEAVKKITAPKKKQKPAK